MAAPSRPGRLRLVLRDPGAAAALLYLALLLVAALAAPWIAPHDPVRLDLGAVLLPPSADGESLKAGAADRSCDRPSAP